MSRISFFLAVVPAAIAQDVPKPVFEPQTIDAKVQIGYGVAIGDVDGDGKSDVVLADKKEIVWYQNPSWEKHLVARDLTLMDNVCVAVRDIDGDGKVEIAAGAQWNPGETTDETKSGAVFYLVRPADLAQPWTPVKLAHEPTVHRMKWVRTGAKEFKLVVAPLHGRGDNPQTGDGEPAKVLAYDVPNDVTKPAGWKTTIVDQSMHKTHNFDVRPRGAEAEMIWLGGREGVRKINFEAGAWRGEPVAHEGMEKGVGEVRSFGSELIALIQPMHGNQVSFYHQGFNPAVLDEGLAQGHALVCDTVLGRGFPEIVAGWREPDKSGKVGLKMFVRDDSTGEEKWVTHVIDDNKMACEDIVAADLNGDKKLDLIASGRATKNLIIYWNRTPGPAAASKERPALPPLSDEEKEAIKKRQQGREEKGKKTD